MPKPRLKTLKPQVQSLAPRVASHTTATERVRGRRLQHRREAWFTEHPLCACCYEAVPRRITAATELDHVIPLFKGGPDDETNFQSLCSPCHEAKTRDDLAGLM